VTVEVGDATAPIDLSSESDGVGEVISEITSAGRDGIGNPTDYAILRAKILDPTNTLETGQLVLALSSAGAGMTDRYLFNHDGIMTAVGAVLTNGRFRYVRDTGCGPPVAGTYVIGDRFADLLGGEWYCTVAGTPGTWVQMVAARAAAVPVAGDFNGGALLDKYRLFYTGIGDGEEFIYDTTQTGWLSAVVHTVTPGPWTAYAPPYAATIDGLFAWTWDPAYDYVWSAVTCQLSCGAGTWDASNKWTAQLKDGTGVLDGVEKTVTGNTRVVITPTTAAKAFIDSSAQTWAYFTLLKTGAPGDVTAASVNMTLRKRLL